MFSFIKESLQSIYKTVTSKLTSLFSQSTIDETTLEELKKLLLEADVGISTTQKLLNQLSDQYKHNKLSTGSELKTALQTMLSDCLQQPTNQEDPRAYLLVGVNGTGKTTCAAKLAYKYKQDGKRVLLAAADTFRAAAVEQLTQWAEKIDVDIISGTENQDPASVVFKAAEEYRNNNYDILIIDTAGRLQTKQNLMNELAKIKRVLCKTIDPKSICTLLSIDAMLGQNSLHQARLFHESTDVTGVLLTKMDGTGKGGIVFAINQELGLPVSFISFGEQLEQLKVFDAELYVHELLNS